MVVNFYLDFSFHLFVWKKDDSEPKVTLLDVPRQMISYLFEQAPLIP